MIWEKGRHSAFTDLARHRGLWLCAFREGISHALNAGKIRVLASPDGTAWESSALFSLKGVDLRDPKLCAAPGGAIDLIMGASPLRSGRYLGRSTLLSRSADGRRWSNLECATEEGDWLWRVERKRARSYGISYRLPSPKRWTIHFLESRDGLRYSETCELGVPGLPNEATLRFRGFEAIALVRREAGRGFAWIGRSSPPYTAWSWHETRMRVGGPNFLVLPDGSLIAAARVWHGKEPRVAVCSMTRSSLEVLLELPSGGDCGYPGMVVHRGELWMSYYSSHEGKARIYIARFALGEQGTKLPQNG
jgi:hypothetical protein